MDFLYAVGMRAKFSIYDHMIQTPEALNMWANFSIYEGFTNTPENATEYV